MTHKKFDVGDLTLSGNTEVFNFVTVSCRCRSIEIHVDDIDNFCKSLKKFKRK